jgi:hypothetical protein
MNAGDSDPANVHNITYSLTGQNWTVHTMRFGGEALVNFTMTDLDGGAGRNIRYLELAETAVIDLISTRVDAFVGRGQDYDIDIGGTQSEYMRISNADLAVRVGDGGRIATLQTDNATTTVTLDGSARIFTMKLDHGVNRVTTGSGHVESYFAYDSVNTLNIGTGGMTQIALAGDGGRQLITAAGWVGSLIVYDQNTSIVTLNGGAGSVYLAAGNNRVTLPEFSHSIRTGDGIDIITLGAGGVGRVTSGGGNDIIRVGAGGADLINAGLGDDQIFLTPMASSGGARVAGGDGTDTVSFAGFGSGVTVSLDTTAFQNVAAPGGDQDLPGQGFVALLGVEYLIGTQLADHLTGSGQDNRLTGNAGHDTLHGGSGNDTLFGATGNDSLKGDDGDDRLDGGAGADTMEGGYGNDTLIGGLNGDTFVFIAGFGTDTVLDFTPAAIGSDRIVFEAALWDGTKTAAQVVADHAVVNAVGNTVFTFGPDARLILSGYADLATLDQYITIM